MNLRLLKNQCLDKYTSYAVVVVAAIVEAVVPSHNSQVNWQFAITYELVEHLPWLFLKVHFSNVQMSSHASVRLARPTKRDSRMQTLMIVLAFWNPWFESRFYIPSCWDIWPLVSILSKCQLISEVIFLCFKSPKKQTKFFEGFLP